MAKLNPFLRPFYLLIAKLKKKGEETSRETNSQKVPIQLVTRISLLQKKAQFWSRPLFAHEKEKRRGWRGRKKTWEKKKNLFLSSGTRQRSNPWPPQRRFGPMVRRPLSLRLPSRRHSYRYPIHKTASGSCWRRFPHRRIVRRC